ncbi:MAG: molybdenum cofactor guanylyltransferase [Marinifilum sp.]|jgi:molybdopterin-guanine dinucleotide biosynthesis protein A|nr:molybdenum cofactor guanylyltransferase [Marinifilum sp.]
MIEKKKTVGIVLSGGKSSRMGTEKGLVQWKGKALIEYAVDCLRNICDSIIISSNKTCYNHLNFPVVKDEIANCGPIGGIYSCMKNIRADYYFIVSCDVPNVPADLFNDLFRNIGDSDLIYAVDESGKKQPLVAVYSFACLPIIEEQLLKGNFKMMKLLDLIQHKEFYVSAKLKYFTPNMLSNANSPDELQKL